MIWEQFCQDLGNIARSNRHRYCLVLSGNPTWTRNEYMRWFEKYPGTSGLIVCNRPGEPIHRFSNGRTAASILPNQVRTVMGQEFDLVCLDSHTAGLDPDALGIVSGTVRAGGIMLIAAPELDTWAELDCCDSDRFLSWGQSFPGKSYFKSRAVDQILNSPGVLVIRENQQPPSIPKFDISAKESEPNFSDQQKAIQAVVHSYTGQRRRPAVLIADRGRGKSAALGLAAQEILTMGAQKIGVTGSGRNGVQTVFKHAGLEPGSDEKIQFYPADVLLSERPALDMLLVDEAAAIPLSQLDSLLAAYPRTAFASTVHGYEGTGHGFTLKFGEILERRTRGWKKIEMTSPIRWAIHDPLESFTNSLLLLDAEPTAPDDLELGTESVSVEQLSQTDLYSSPGLLRDVFALLVQAHYRTRPYDLRHLLDNPGCTILAARYRGHVLGVLLANNEGGLDETIAHEIWKNHRRPSGHLLPEILSSQCGHYDAALLRAIRIMRIAVHQKYRRFGIGRKLVQSIHAIGLQETDYLGTSFSVDPGVIKFWIKCGFVSARLSLGRDGVTGSHSVTMVSSVTDTGDALVQQANDDFLLNYSDQLKSDALADFNPELVPPLLVASSKSRLAPNFSESELRNLAGIGYASLPVDNFPALLEKLFLVYLQIQSADVCCGDRFSLLIERILQGKDWSCCNSLNNSDGKKQGEKQIRELVRDMLEKLSVPGLQSIISRIKSPPCL